MTCGFFLFFFLFLCNKERREVLENLFVLDKIFTHSVYTHNKNDNNKKVSLDFVLSKSRARRRVVELVASTPHLQLQLRETRLEHFLSGHRMLWSLLLLVLPLLVAAAARLHSHDWTWS